MANQAFLNRMKKRNQNQQPVQQNPTNQYFDEEDEELYEKPVNNQLIMSKPDEPVVEETNDFLNSINNEEEFISNKSVAKETIDNSKEIIEEDEIESPVNSFLPDLDSLNIDLTDDLSKHNVTKNTVVEDHDTNEMSSEMQDFLESGYNSDIDYKDHLKEEAGVKEKEAIEDVEPIVTEVVTPEEPRRRGRPRMVNTTSTAKAETANFTEMNIVKEEQHDSKFDSKEVYKEYKTSKVTSNNSENTNSELGNQILEFICSKTISDLSEIYTSKIYTTDFSKSLCCKFINKEIDASNSLFSEFLTECIENDVQVPYLGENTTLVLKYIKERN